MKSILKLIRRFIITLILSFVLLLFLNIFLYGLWIVKYVSKEPPMDYTFKVASIAPVAAAMPPRSQSSQKSAVVNISRAHFSY